MVTVELKSVNHRFREVWLHIPREWASADDKIKSLVYNEIHRGRVDVFANFSHLGATGSRYKVDASLLETALELAHNLIEQKRASDAVINHILAIPGLFVEENAPLYDERLEALLLFATRNALQEMIIMRRTEGVQLQAHLQARLVDMQHFVEEVKRLYPRSVELYRIRLKQRVESILQNEIPDERLALETAIAAEKTSLEEEWERLASHLLQMEALLARDNESAGRKMDFLLQEMVREVNTIGAKASDLEISNLVLEAKHALEQMREQTQNVE